MLNCGVRKASRESEGEKAACEGMDTETLDQKAVVTEKHRYCTLYAIG